MGRLTFIGPEKKVIERVTYVVESLYPSCTVSVRTKKESTAFKAVVCFTVL